MKVGNGRERPMWSGLSAPWTLGFLVLAKSSMVDWFKSDLVPFFKNVKATLMSRALVLLLD